VCLRATLVGPSRTTHEVWAPFASRAFKLIAEPPTIETHERKREREGRGMGMKGPSRPSAAPKFACARKSGSEFKWAGGWKVARKVFHNFCPRNTIPLAFLPSLHLDPGVRYMVGVGER